MTDFDIPAPQAAALVVPLAWLDAQLAYRHSNTEYAQRLTDAGLPSPEAGKLATFPEDEAPARLQRAAKVLREDAQLNYVVIGAGSAYLHRDGEGYLLVLMSGTGSRMLRGLTETGVALWSWDVVSDHYHWSAPAAAIFGMPLTSMPADHAGFLKCVHDEDRAGLSVQIATALSQDTDFDVEFRLASGAQVVQMRGHMERDGNGFGRPTSVVGVCWDVTERRQSDLRLRDTTLALEYANKQLIRCNQELEEFAYITSHDLKAPLRGIYNYAQFLAEDYADKLDDEGQRMLSSLSRQTRDMDRLIEALLRYSRVGREGVNFQSTNFDEVLDAVLASMKEAGQLKGVTIVRPLPLPTLHCDRALTADLLEYLVSNAVQFNKSDTPQVEIGYDAADSPVIYVRDNGIGIDVNHFDKIFKIFRRLHLASDYGGGVGVGLTMAEKIVRTHGGRIWLTSELGKGSTFYFTLGPTSQALR